MAGFFTKYKKMGKVLNIQGQHFGKQASLAYSDLRGYIYPNLDVVHLYDENEKTFAYLHEAGHIELFTEDENLADNYAFVEYVKLGLPTASIMSCLNKCLPNNNLSKQRIQFMSERVRRFEELKKIQSLNGAGDWLNIIGQAFGIGAQVAGGTSTDQQLAIEEAKRVQTEEANKKTVSYILIGTAIITVVLVSFFILKK